MRILIVCAYSLKLNTSGTLQNLIIIDGLKRLGHEIDVLTTEIPKTHESYDESLSLTDITHYYELKLPDLYSVLRTRKKQGALVGKIKEAVKLIYNEFQIMDGYVSVADKVGDLNIENPLYDYVISLSDPKSSHVIAKKFINEYKVSHTKWIQYWGDPLYLDISRKKKRFLEKRVKETEEQLLEGAARVVYATPFTAEAAKRLFPKKADKIVYCTQGYWKSYLEKNNNNNNDIYTIGYFGNYNPRLRNITPLINAMDGIKHNNIQLYVGGSGMILTETDNIKVLGHLSHDQVMDYELSCDLIVCLLNSRGTQIPGNFYYYASLNKPILVIIDGEHGDDIMAFLDEFKRYEFCRNQKEDIIKAIREIKNKKECYQIKVSQRLSPEYIARVILNGAKNE